MYDHTSIASYRHWCVGNVGRQVRPLALDGRDAEIAGGFPSDPILSGPCRTYLDINERRDRFLTFLDACHFLL